MRPNEMGLLVDDFKILKLDFTHIFIYLFVCLFQMFPY